MLPKENFTLTKIKKGQIPSRITYLNVKSVQLFSHNRSSKIGNFYQLGGKVNYAHLVVTRNYSSNFCGAEAHNSRQWLKNEIAKISS